LIERERDARDKKEKYKRPALFESKRSENLSGRLAYQLLIIEVLKLFEYRLAIAIDIGLLSVSS